MTTSTRSTLAPKPASSGQNSRQERLAKALKANLQRRKAASPKPQKAG